MKRILTVLILSASTNVFAENYNSISVQGLLNPPTPILNVKVWIRSGGPGGAIVGTASEVALLPDVDGVFSTQTYISNPWIFQTGSDYIMQLSSSTGEVLSTFSITAVPFALTVRGDAQTGNQNVFGAYGNVGIGTGSPLYRLEVSSAAGSSENMVVISTGGTPVIRMTGAGGIYANNYYGDGSSLTGITGAGDNLGNHTATTNLLMGGNSIYNAYNITSTGWLSANIYQISGVDVLRVSAGDPETSLSLGRGAHSMSGAYNVLIGNSAGSSVTSGYSNTLVGYEAGRDIVDGHGNTAIGQRAGELLDNSYFNTFVGVDVGKGGPGTANTCVGAFSCGSATNFGYNVALGYQAGLNFTTGSANIFIGNDAAKDLLTGNNNIVLGYAGKLSSTDASNELNIGGVIFGDLAAKTVGISTRVPQAALDIVSTGTANNRFAQIWRDSSGVIKSSMSATGVLMATKFIGDGSGLTGISGDNLGNHSATTNLAMGGFNIYGAGDIVMSRAYFNPNVEISLAASSQLGGVYVSSNIYIVGTSLINGQNASGYSLSLSSGINMPTGTVSAGLFNGSGASLTSMNASSLVSGTVGDNRLSPNVKLLNANQEVTGTNNFTGQNTFSNATTITDLRSANTAISVSSLPIGTFSVSGAGDIIGLSTVTIITYGEPVLLQWAASCTIGGANGSRVMQITPSRGAISLMGVAARDYNITSSINVARTGTWIDYPSAGTYSYVFNFLALGNTASCNGSSTLKMQFSATRLH